MRHNKEEIEAKATLLAKVLEKHDPETLKDKAFDLMQQHPSDSPEFKCFAALYEIMDIFKV